MGSIPAPAGEPVEIGAPDAVSRVYPRACGGTRGRQRVGMFGMGLSPRLRGNRLRTQRRRHAKRSIPAPAGEPR